MHLAKISFLFLSVYPVLNYPLIYFSIFLNPTVLPILIALVLFRRIVLLVDPALSLRVLPFLLCRLFGSFAGGFDGGVLLSVILIVPSAAVVFCGFCTSNGHRSRLRLVRNMGASKRNRKDREQYQIFMAHAQLN